MRRIEIRPIENREQLEACFDLWAMVFPEERAFFQRRIDLDSAYDMATTWAAYVNGDLAASIQIFPYEMDIEGIRLKIGGIGSVATHPDYRRLGLAQSLLRAQSRWMQKCGYDASLLFTGIFSFYEQVGWRSIHEEIYRLTEEACMSEKGLARGAEEPSDVVFRPLEQRDLQEAAVIYESWRTRHTGAWIRSSTYWQDAWHWLRDDTMAVERAERLVAYARFRVRQGVLEIREFAYDDGNVQLVLPLWQKLLSDHPEISSVHAQLPSDHALSLYLQSRGIDTVPDAGAMWKVIDVHRLVQKLQPLLSTRVRTQCQDNWRYVLQVEGEDICLLVGPQGVELLDRGSDIVCYDEKDAISLGQMMEWLLYGAPDAENVSRLGKILFPRRTGVLWRTDHF